MQTKVFEEGEVWEQLVSRAETENGGLAEEEGTNIREQAGAQSPWANIPYNGPVLDYVLSRPAPGSTALSVAYVLHLSPLLALVM